MIIGNNDILLYINKYIYFIIVMLFYIDSILYYIYIYIYIYI